MNTELIDSNNRHFLFTVVIIAYNVGDYISKCVTSAIEQTTKAKYEILIIDDGSTDNTPNIVDDFSRKTENIRVIHKKNEGSGYARNEGIRNAKGKWILFVDGDDYLDSKAIESFEKFTDSGIDACIGRIKSFLDRTDDEPTPIKPLIDEKLIQKCESGKECFALIRKTNGSIDLGTKGIFRKEYLVNNNIYQKRYKRGQDNDWAVRMFRYAGKMAYNSYPYYCYRKGRTGSAVNSNSIEKALGVLQMQQEWMEIASEEENEYGEQLAEETLKRFWAYFKIYATSLTGDDLAKYCDAVDKAKGIYSGTKERKIWMRCLDRMGAYKTAKMLVNFRVVKIEDALRRIKSKM